MDLTRAVILLAVVGGIVELVKALLGDRAKNPRVLVGVVIVASFGATFLLRYSVWAHDQVVNGKALDTLNTGSLIVVAIMVAAAESVVFLGGKAVLGAVANIGQNQPTAYDPRYGQPIDKPGG